MKKLKERTFYILTSVILAVLAAGIVAVCFIPDREVVVISLGKSYSPVYNGNRAEKKVALMFNVYEGAEIVEEICGVLRANGATATFFIGGCWAEDNGETLVKILENGNEIGSHGYFHKDHSKLDENGNREEMVSTADLIKRLTGVEVKLFAPPSGAFSDKTLKVAESLGYKTVLWSKDTVDWRDKNEKTVYNRATKNIAGGDFVLMHPKEHTLAALDGILKYYASIGLRAVTVSECLK